MGISARYLLKKESTVVTCHHISEIDRLNTDGSCWHPPWPHADRVWLLPPPALPLLPGHRRHHPGHPHHARRYCRESVREGPAAERMRGGRAADDRRRNPVHL